MLHEKNEFNLDMPHRPRRRRRTPAMRGLVRETRLTAQQLIYPLFVHEGPDEPIDAMPGCMRWSMDGLCAEVGRAAALGICAVVLFPKVDNKYKSTTGDEAYNPQGLIPKAITRLKSEYPDVLVITDVALDPYSSDGHDGIVDQTGEILNDQTVQVLCKQALMQAQAGADIVAPSDMMDGRVAAIRQTLDANGYTNVSIMSYSAKYASAFYGPFRGALNSAPKASGSNGKKNPGDKLTYQMDPANAREAITEALLDEAEGADIIMVKPAGAYLDIIYRLTGVTTLPIAAYQVSGEYLMIKAASEGGWIDEKKIVLESLLAITRAGADMILTYYAPQAALWLNEA
ncbi:MAG: porphobilinogen synthase [Phycisphaeraceae bacterium]|nr:porphobilinogen synthase [Phycisphaeraceae bacterium]